MNIIYNMCNIYKHVYKFRCMLNKCKTVGCNESSRSLFQDHCSSVAYWKCVAKFTQKLLTKPYSKEGKRTNKDNLLQHHHIIIIILISAFPILLVLDDFLCVSDFQISLSLDKLSPIFLSLKPTKFTLSKLWFYISAYVYYLLHTRFT